MSLVPIRTEIRVVNGLSRTIALLKFLVDGPHRRRNFVQHCHAPDCSQLHFLSGWNTRACLKIVFRQMCSIKQYLNFSFFIHFHVD